jgi:hypothetical protein
MIKELIITVIILLAAPIGLLIAWWSRDELIAGRKWFKIIISLSIILGWGFALKGNFTLSLSFLFIVLFTFASLIKSYDKKWTRKKI